MASYDGINYLLRKGTLEDPYILINDTATIINGKAMLQEIPDYIYKVRVTNYIEITQDRYNQTKTLNSNQFLVDYSTGMIKFNVSENGKTVPVEYKGRGIIQFPAERVYVNSDNIWAVDNLQDLINLIESKELELNTAINTSVLEINQKTLNYSNDLTSKETEFNAHFDLMILDLEGIRNNFNTACGNLKDTIILKMGELNTNFDNKIDTSIAQQKAIIDNLQQDIQDKITFFTNQSDSILTMVRSYINQIETTKEHTYQYLYSLTETFIYYVTKKMKDFVDYIKTWIDRAEEYITQIIQKIAESQTATENCIEATNNSITQTDLCKDATDEANYSANTTIVKWLPYVNAYADIFFRYPVPENGWTTVVKGSNEIYRYNGLTDKWEFKRKLQDIFPTTDETHNGLYPSEDYIKLSQIDSQAQRNYEGEEAKNALPDYCHTHILTFGIVGLIQAGIKGYLLQFPYDGEITDIRAYCNSAPTQTVELTINKIAETEFTTGSMWVNMLSTNVKIESGQKVRSGDLGYNSKIVRAGDYFRLNILSSNETMQDLTVQIFIKY